MRGSLVVALIALTACASPARSQNPVASTWHLVDGGNRLVYGPQSGDPAVGLGCGPMATVEVWIADPTRAYRSKGVRQVMLTALHGIENHDIRYASHRGGTDAIVYTVDAKSLMWTAMMMDRGVGLYNGPKEMRIPDGASQLVKDYIPGCFSPTGASKRTAQATSTGQRQTAPARGTMPNITSRALADVYKSCKKPVVENGFVNERDVNGDGIADWYLDFNHYNCDGAQDFCGSAGCQLTVFASTPSGFQKVFEDNVYKYSFSTRGDRSIMVLDMHGSNCGKVGAAPCRKDLTWDGDTYR